MATQKTPGVYVEEISLLPPSVAQVETAIPAFIGYTRETKYHGQTLVNKPKRIKSLADFHQIFGSAPAAIISNITPAPNPLVSEIRLKQTEDSFEPDGEIADPFANQWHNMFYCLQLYFANGGGPCYIVSCGAYKSAKIGMLEDDMSKALDALKKEDEPTMIVFADSSGLTIEDHYSLCKKALVQCGTLMDRVLVADVLDLSMSNPSKTLEDSTGEFRNQIGTNNLSYGAAYFPWLITLIPYHYHQDNVKISGGPIGVEKMRIYPTDDATELSDADKKKSLYHADNALYWKLYNAIDKFTLLLPPAAAIAGVYARIDESRGVWKAPANVGLNLVKDGLIRIDDEDQKDMNVTSTGKSVNAIRKFTGKGILVWGARTLAGNDNEWRYISVRRFYNMVEESVKKATEPFVFEPNDANTWVKVRGMIENFLILQWRAGALQGAKPEDAFFVNIGLGETMTALDILEGRMIVEIGMAVVRPAEFIILRFSHKMVAE